MYRIRTTERMIAEEYKYQEMRCPTHLSIGQELVPAIYSCFIKKNDFAVSTHRGHAHYLSKGGDLKKMIAELYGKETGCSKGKGGSMHLIDLAVNFMGTSAIVGNSIPTGVGLGLSLKLKKQNSISTVFLGDGATEEGVFYESLNFSATKKIPVLFICENNFFSVYSPMEVRQPKKRSITKFVKSMGIESIKCVNHDISNYFESIKFAFDYVRLKKLPFFIELETHRHLEHCGPNNDDNLNYRTNNFLKKWKEKDPLDLITAYFMKTESIDFLEKITKVIDKEIQDAFTFAKESKFPPSSNAYKDLFYYK